jgi:transcription-repair coupling factor (superfamily II helicase)
MLPSTQRDAAAEATPVYHPVPPETLFLGDEQWRAALAKRRAVEFTPFDAPEDMDGVVNAGGRPPPDFAVARTSPDLAKALIDKETARPVVITAHSDGSRDRLAAMLTEHGASTPVLIESWRDVDTHEAGKTLLGILDIDHGFTAPDRIVVSEQDILGERLIRAARKRRQAEHFITEVSSLNAGDIVVHVDNGIGRYEGLETLTVGGAPHDCLRVLYAGDDRLYVPVENIDVLSRYGAEESTMQLDRLGATAWQARKARVKERIREIADQLLKVAAERTMQAGEEMQPQSAEFEEFCARFSFSETDDQQQAIDDVVEDLASGRAMDRLVCGDVGFGKTEVALRAAFVAAMTGTQVALVVPTTLLAAQHYKTFSERFAGLPIRIEQLSRLVPSGKAAMVREELSAGMINIVIGTQSLLAKSIEFDNLGLLIVDEEQHFGVAQKERLKQLKANVHVLTLTATPIPRTLQMALAGVREMSIIATPPVDRLAVRTFVLPYDPVMIREAIRRESYRGGQTFYVCPRVADISRVHDRLKDLVPEAKVGIAHGQMPTTELENVMTGFSDAEYDILLSTNIIEAGLDIPSANTMIVHRADRFGLAQLYQLRGRIGRSKTRAYAYLTLPPGQKITETASKRLAVMQSLDTLGAGFTLASHDLDIRGAGNLLGDEQSGHIKEVGVELYQQLLEEAITKLRDGETDEIMEEGWSPQISVGTSVLIPDTYVSDLSVRLGLYRRLSVLSTRDDIDGLAAEMIDRFGPLPDEVKNLMEIMEIKQFCKTASIEKIDAGPKGAVLSFRNNEFANPEGLIGFIHKEAGRVRLRPDHSLLCMRRWDRQQERLDGVRDLVSTLARIAATGE